MLLNYHEMTMTEGAGSYQKKLQFRVICSIITSCFVYSVWISGILLTIKPYEAIFPGGQLCYKQITRDYVASMGLGRRILTDVLEAFPEEDDKADGISRKDRKKMIEEKMYHIYLDNPEDVGGGHMRFMTGILTVDKEEKRDYCHHLIEKNPGIERVKDLNKDEPEGEKDFSDLFKEVIYQYVDLPPVKSLAIKFPFSNGFTSALVLEYKIIPELRALASKQGEPGNSPAIVSQCSEAEGECTHYVTLEKGATFHGGLPSTSDYQKGITDAFSLVSTLKGGLRVLFPSLKPYLPVTSDDQPANDSEEL
jgi:hypothetical protein